MKSLLLLFDIVKVRPTVVLISDRMGYKSKNLIFCGFFLQFRGILAKNKVWCIHNIKDLNLYITLGQKAKTRLDNHV